MRKLVKSMPDKNDAKIVRRMQGSPVRPGSRLHPRSRLGVPAMPWTPLPGFQPLPPPISHIWRRCPGDTSFGTAGLLATAYERPGIVHLRLVSWRRARLPRGGVRHRGEVALRQVREHRRPRESPVVDPDLVTAPSRKFAAWLNDPILGRRPSTCTDCPLAATNYHTSSPRTATASPRRTSARRGATSPPRDWRSS